MPKVRKHAFEEGDIAVQINCPESDKFIMVTNKSNFPEMVYHKHIGKTSRFGTQMVRVAYLRKCTKKELLLVKIQHGL